MAVLHPYFVMEKINEPKDIVEKGQASSWNNIYYRTLFFSDSRFILLLIC